MRRRFVSLSLSLLTLIPAAVAQSPEDSHGPRLLEESRRTPLPTHHPSIHVDVDMTLVPVTVTDQVGRNVGGLTKQNFQIYDGTEERPIVTFSRQDAPVSVGLVYDASRSMTDKFQTSREAAARLFAQLNPQDEAFVVTVSNRAVLRHDFTHNLGDIGDALNFVRPDGTTALLDGVYLALSKMKKAHNPRKALVVVSDGGDNNSRYSLKELQRLAVESDVLIYAIGIVLNPRSPEEMGGPELLSDLSHKTGGMRFLIQDLGSVGPAMATIGETLHNQYMLGYYRPEDAESGKYRKIKVKLLVPTGMPRMQIYARTGYYVP